MPRNNGWRHDERRTISEALSEMDGEVGVLNRWYRDEPKPVEVLLQYIAALDDTPHDYRVRINGVDVPDLEASTRGEARSQAFDYMDNTPRSAHDDSVTERPEVPLDEVERESEPDPDVDISGFMDVEALDDEQRVELARNGFSDEEDLRNCVQSDIAAVIGKTSAAEVKDEVGWPEPDEDDEDEPTQCQAETSEGEQCQNNAVEGSDYCHVESHGADDETDEPEAVPA